VQAAQHQIVVAGRVAAQPLEGQVQPAAAARERDASRR